MSRYLRITAAVVFALLGLAFLALWVRSLERLEMITGSLPSANFTIASHRHMLAVTTFHSVAEGQERNWYVGSMRLPRKKSIIPAGPLGFSAARDSSTIEIVLPHWFLAISSLALAALLAFRRTWRFTVRGLLIATTIITAVLGALVYVV